MAAVALIAWWVWKRTHIVEVAGDRNGAGPSEPAA
jgi:hypothetical protein